MVTKIGISKSIDILSLSHFLFWLFIGLLLPNKYILVIIVSILWEIFEFCLVYFNPLYIFVKKYWFVPEKYWNETLTNKILDIIVNLCGYTLGGYILLYKEKKTEKDKNEKENEKEREREGEA